MAEKKRSERTMKAGQQIAMSFHNSTNETGKILSVAEQTAKYQDGRIQWFMRDNVRAQGWTSNELHEHFPDMLLTSVRRSLTNLMKEGEVYQTGEKRKGSYGMNVLVWQYRDPLNKQQ